ncbi:unnamed protein product [Heterobilharzia americana]|nr:unnamed protein product [Heterobilharzia americana]
MCFSQLKSTIIELEEQKQITASRTTELSVFNVVKQEIERLTNTLNNDRASFIQEKITLQKKLNEQQTEIHKLMERLALYEGQVIHSTQYYRNNCIDNSSIHLPRKTYQDFNKVDQLTEAERRSIYEECNLSISSDLSNKSLMTEKKVTKLSNTIPIQLSDEWSKRLELSRRRIAQLQLVSEQFDSIYEEWKSVDLRQFLSKLHSDLPNVLHNINLDGFINCNEIALHNPFIMNKDDNQLDDIMPPMYHVDDSKSMQLNHQHCKESPASGTQEDGNKPLFIETNPESRRNDNAELQNIHDVKDQSYASSLHDSTYGSDINTPKSNHLSDLQRSSNEGLNIVSKTSAVSGFNHLQSDCPNYSTEYLNHIRPDFIQSTESISQSQSVQSLPLRNSQSTSLKSGTTNCKVSPRSHKKDQRMRAINVEHSDNEMEENEISNQISSGKKDVNNELKNNKAESIEDGFPLLLKTPRTDRTEGETASLTESIDILNGKCSPRNDTVEVKRSSTEGKTQTIGLSLSNIHQNGHNADCDIMEKYLRLSLDNQSKPLVSTNNQTNTIQPIMTNGLHSPSPKNIRTWVESNYHFSSSESDISFKKRDLSSLEKFIGKKPIQNGDEVDSGSDYVW